MCVQITVILLNWVSSHFPDFEGHEHMTEFLEWFEAMLLKDVSRQQCVRVCVRACVRVCV